MRFDPTRHIHADKGDAVTPSDYIQSPAKAFLTHASHLADGLNMCERKFQKKKDGTFHKDADDSIHRLCTATFGSLMSQFETFQKYLFAGMFEWSRAIPTLKVKHLQDRLKTQIEIKNAASYRGQSAVIGVLVANSLNSWHDPAVVNGYLKAFVPGNDLYDNEAQSTLRVLWQVRHTVVHTSGWLSASDAHKVDGLASLADKPLVLGVPFVRSSIQWMHRYLKTGMTPLQAAFEGQVDPSTPAAHKDAIKALFLVDSPRKSYFR